VSKLASGNMPPKGRRSGPAEPPPVPDAAESKLVSFGRMEVLPPTTGPTPARILVCDHRGSGLDRALAALSEAGLELEASSSLRQSLWRLAEAGTDPGNGGAVDAIVLDPLTDSGGTELTAIETARSRALERPPVPLLLVADADDEEAALRADKILGRGSWDLVRRGERPREIARRLRRLVEERRAALEMTDLRHRALHDDRTDLLRPAAFEKRLVEHFSAAQRHRHELAFVMIDLDRFGAINKRHDHMVGDELITRVGEAIRRSLRVEDAAGRLGGDEFAVLLPYTGKIDAAMVVNRLRKEISKLSGRPEGAKGEIEVSASIGFETFDGTDLESVDKLRRHAERALRRAKEKGGNRGEYFRNL